MIEIQEFYYGTQKWCKVHVKLKSVQKQKMTPRKETERELVISGSMLTPISTVAYTTHNIKIYPPIYEHKDVFKVLALYGNPRVASIKEVMMLIWVLFETLQFQDKALSYLYLEARFCQARKAMLSLAQ